METAALTSVTRSAGVSLTTPTIKAEERHGNRAQRRGAARRRRQLYCRIDRRNGPVDSPASPAMVLKLQADLAEFTECRFQPSDSFVAVHVDAPIRPGRCVLATLIRRRRPIARGDLRFVAGLGAGVGGTLRPADPLIAASELIVYVTRLYGGFSRRQLNPVQQTASRRPTEKGLGHLPAFNGHFLLCHVAPEDNINSVESKVSTISVAVVNRRKSGLAGQRQVLLLQAILSVYWGKI